MSPESHVLHQVLLRKSHLRPVRYKRSEIPVLHLRDVLPPHWWQAEILCISYKDLHQSGYGNLQPHGRWIFRYHAEVRHVLPCGHPHRSLLPEVRKAVPPRWNVSVHSVHNWYGTSYVQGDAPAPDGCRAHQLQVLLLHLPHGSCSLLLSVLSQPSPRSLPDESCHLRSVFRGRYEPPHGGSDQSRIRSLLPEYHRWSDPHPSWFPVYGCFCLLVRWSFLSFRHSEAVLQRS